MDIINWFGIKYNKKKVYISLTQKKLEENFKENRTHIIVLCIIFIIAATLRFWSIDWGKPLLLHPDELKIVNPAVHLWQEKTLDPNEYSHPGHISIYLNGSAYQIYSLSRFKAPLTDTFAIHKLTFYHLSRAIVAFIGTLSVGVAYLIGRQYAKNIGTIFALLFALFPPFIEHSHYITTDITLTFFIMLVVYMAILCLKKFTILRLMIMSMFAGIATCEKYPGLLSLLLVFLVITITHKKNLRDSIHSLYYSSIGFIVAIFVCAPFLILRYEEVIKALYSESRTTHPGADGLTYIGNVMFYTLEFLSNTGGMMIALVIMGGVLLIIKEKVRSFPLFFGIAFGLFMSKIPLHWVRWALPIYISSLFLAGYAMHYIWETVCKICREKLSTPQKKRRVSVLIRGIICLPILGMSLNSIMLITLFSFQTTLYQSLLFCKSQGITPHNSIYEGYTPLLPGHPFFIFIQLYNELGKKSHTINYIILSSAMYNRFYAEPKKYAKQINLYERVKDEYDLIKAFPSVEAQHFNMTRSPEYNPHFRWFPILKALSCIKRLSDISNMPLQGPEILIYQIK